jgi:hypothetical protein
VADRPRRRPPDTALAGTPERQIGVSLPVPLDVRLDVLVERAIAAGERTSRKELLAAIILATSTDGEALSRLVRNLRQATIGDAVVPGEDVWRFLPEAPPGPGPRPRRPPSS